MKTPVIDGQSIDRFIPANLRHMFYRHFMPQYKYAIHNGYAPYNFPTNGLVLYLPLWALKGSPIKSVDAYKHSCAITGALWRPYGRYFDGNDDKIDCGDDTSLDLTTALTIGCWIRTSRADVDQYLAHREDGTLENYRLGIHSTNKIIGVIYVAGAAKFHLATTVLAQDTWYLAAYTYNKVSIQVYLDGVTDGAPTAEAGNIDNDDVSLVIGLRPAGPDDRQFQGDIGATWIYNRALSAAEILHIYNATKWRYQ